MSLSRFILILPVLIYFASCGNREKENQPILIQTKDITEDIIKINKPALILEKDQIESYIKSHGFAMKTTGTGLYYMIVTENKKGRPIIFGDEIKVKYKVSLLDGSTCYSSEKNGPKQFKVGTANVETGVHEGVQLMKLGEKAVFIMPSHLAQGLSGDQDKIPPKSPVVYEVEIISMKN